MRILLADDHALFRDGLAALLTAWGHSIVGAASSADEAVTLAVRNRPQLVLMDIRMPGGGIAATRAIKALRPETQIVMLTVSEDEEDLFAAVKAGASGYLLKNVRGHELRAMIDAVGRGEAALSPASAKRILEEFARAAPGAGRSDRERLTDRERDVLAQLVGGATNKEIAAALGISENTVKYHLKHILAKLHAESRTEAAVRAARERLLGDRSAAEDPYPDG